MQVAARVRPDLIKGAAWGLLAGLIGGGWMVTTRLGLQNSLNAYDLIAFRYAVPAVVLLPLIFRGALRGVPPWAVIVMVIGAGAPYGAIAASGLHFATAAQGGAFNAGTVPLFTALFSVVVLKLGLRPIQVVGLVLIPVGAVLIAGFDAVTASGNAWIGHLMFIFTAIIWSVYTVVMRKHGIQAFNATAIVAVFSCLFYLPLYPLVFGSNIPDAPIGEILGHLFYQGLLTGLIFYVAFNRAVVLLGGAASSVFLGLVPVFAAFLAIPVLGEWPTWYDLAGIALITAGIWLGSGARLR